MSRTVDDDTDVGTITLAIVGAIAIIPVILAWQGYVLSIMWAWFFCPLGAPNIGVANAIGVTILVRTIIPSRTEGQKFSVTVTVGLLAPVITLLFGWLVHLFM